MAQLSSRRKARDTAQVPLSQMPPPLLCLKEGEATTGGGEKDALRTDRPWRSLERNLGRRGGLFPEEQFGKKFIVKPRKVLQVDFPPG